MKNIPSFLLLINLMVVSPALFAQKLETVYLNSQDTTRDKYIAMLPEKVPVKAFMFLLDGFGASPADVLVQTSLPRHAAERGILTIIPILSTGPLYFGSDVASQQSLKAQIAGVVDRYNLKGKAFFIGGFSIGGTCALKYAELAVKDNYPVKPKAVFSIDSPLDWERYYKSAERVIRLSGTKQVNSEIPYMIDRIKKEMNGNPQQVIENFYNNSPYSFTDTTQRAVKLLAKTPVMLITEPDVQWWLRERGYDYSIINTSDIAAFINELQHLGNTHAVMIATIDKGYRQPDKVRHPHSWSIANPLDVVKWLLSFSDN